MPARPPPVGSPSKRPPAADTACLQSLRFGPCVPTNPIQPVLAPAAAAAPAAVRAWQAGQLLQAMALTNTTNGHVLLRIGDVQVQARTHLTLRAGQELTLQVERNGTQTVLRLAEATPQDPSARIAREALPRQLSLPPLLANLGALATATDPEPLGLSQQILATARKLFQALPDTTVVRTAEGLRAAVRDSGLFLEARLAGKIPQANQANADLKANLLRLRQALVESQSQQPGTAGTGAARERVPLPTADPYRPPMRGTAPFPQTAALPTLPDLPREEAPQALLRQVEGALARLELGQVAALAGQETLAWLVEIPVRNGTTADLLHLQIVGEGAGGGAMQRRAWSVTLAFDLPGLGAVSARLVLDEDRVSVTLWAERASSARRFDAHLAELHEALEECGVRPGKLTCHEGQPPGPQLPAARDVLVDERG